MIVRNIFCLNDWEIQPLLRLIFSLMLAFWGSIGIEALGLSIPLLQQVLGFLFLTFVPGLLFLRVLQIHHLGAVRTTVYAVGLSLAVLMFTGFFMNTVYPFFGITRPISLWPIILTISGVVLLLSILAYLQDRTFSSPDNLNLQDLLAPPILTLSLLPFGAIAGTYLMNYYSTNIVLMILLLLIALIPVALTCTHYIPEKYYSYAIFSVALTLLYHVTLISPYIWGWDVQYEYYIINNVIQNGFWDSTVSSTCNAMLSLVMICPFYSTVLNLDLDWVFKIVYPFLFTLVPLGLYTVFEHHTNKKIAFLACFFFMSFYTFYFEMFQLARQEIAEIFVVLIILSMVDHNLHKIQKTVFFLVFSMSLITSHYGLSYIFLFILLVMGILVSTGHYIKKHKSADQFLFWMRNRLHNLLDLDLQKFSFHSPLLLLNFIFFYVVFILTWYIYISSSSSFYSIINLAYHIATSISSEILNSDAVQGLAVLTAKSTTPLHEVSKYLQMLTLLFIMIGFILVWGRNKEFRFDLKYLFMAFGALCICAGGIILPYFASALNTSRLYHICLIFLAPFCIVGGLAIISWLEKLFKDSSHSFSILSVFFGIFFLFNCGWIYEVYQDNPTSFALNGNLVSPIINEGEMYGAEWLIDKSSPSVVYCDMYKLLLFTRFSESISSSPFPPDGILVSRSSYLFFGTSNIDRSEIILKYKIGVNDFHQWRPIGLYCVDCDEVYNSGYSLIYYY